MAYLGVSNLECVLESLTSTSRLEYALDKAKKTSNEAMDKEKLVSAVIIAWKQMVGMHIVVPQIGVVKALQCKQHSLGKPLKVPFTVPALMNYAFPRYYLNEEDSRKYFTPKEEAKVRKQMSRDLVLARAKRDSKRENKKKPKLDDSDTSSSSESESEDEAPPMRKQIRNKLTQGLTRAMNGASTEYEVVTSAEVAEEDKKDPKKDPQVKQHRVFLTQVERAMKTDLKKVVKQGERRGDKHTGYKPNYGWLVRDMLVDMLVQYIAESFVGDPFCVVMLRDFFTHALPFYSRTQCDDPTTEHMEYKLPGKTQWVHVDQFNGCSFRKYAGSDAAFAAITRMLRRRRDNVFEIVRYVGVCLLYVYVWCFVLVKMGGYIYIVVYGYTCISLKVLLLYLRVLYNTKLKTKTKLPPDMKTSTNSNDPSVIAQKACSGESTSSTPSNSCGKRPFWTS